MPMYEFDCEACGERYEDLVAIGTEACECRACGSANTHRVLSAQAAPWVLNKTLGARRAQEARNVHIRKDAKKRFKDTMRQVRAAHNDTSQSGGGPDKGS